MKVVLAALNSKYIHSNLAIRYLKAYTEDLPYECEFVELSVNDRKERILEEIISRKPDIVGFSCYIWNIEYVEAIGKLIKLVDENIKILYGGPEVSYNAAEFLLANAGDYLIEGEGEEPYRQFIEANIEKKSLAKIKALYVKEVNSIFYGGPREGMDMEKIVFPYKENDELQHKIVYYEASRGCPFKCKYCLSSTMQGVRFLDVDRVKRELQYLIDKKVGLVKFVDRTFNCNSKYAMEIWRFIIEQDAETSFHFEISADLLKDEEIALLNKAPQGRIQFEVGVQTTNPEVLKNINRYVGFEKIKEKVLRVKEAGNIKQHLDLIAGLPGEDFLSFKQSFNDVHRIEPEEIQLGFLKLLRGSSMREEAEKWQMAYSPYPPYEILKTGHLRYDEILLLKRVEEMVDKYYNSQKFKTILHYFIPKFETPFDFYFELGMFFYRKGLFQRSISSALYYEVFLQFSEEFLKCDDKYLKDIIKYDYLCFNKKRGLPSFIRGEENKELERQLREKITAKTDKKMSSSLFIERFFIDITTFKNTGSIKTGEFYMLFDMNSTEEPEDITMLLQEQHE